MKPKTSSKILRNKNKTMHKGISHPVLPKVKININDYKKVKSKKVRIKIIKSYRFRQTDIISQVHRGERFKANLMITRI